MLHGLVRHFGNEELNTRGGASTAVHKYRSFVHLI